MGHSEIFICLSNGKRAFWIRYLLSARKEKEASFMVAMFNNGGSSGYRTPYETFSMNPYGATKIGGNTVDTEKAHASDIEDSYYLDWESREPSMSTLTGLTRILDLRSQYVLLSPNALFNGQIKFLSESYVVRDYRGMVGYISQPDYCKWLLIFPQKRRNKIPQLYLTLFHSFSHFLKTDISYPLPVLHPV